MDDEGDLDGATPWWRYAIAATLGLSILGLTYVLFDPELGTPVPLFQEFTCRGRIALEVANGFHEPYLTPPSSAVYFRATHGDNESLPVWASVETREGSDGKWTLLLSRSAPEGDGYVFIPAVSEETQARVIVKDLSGKVCGAVSRTITAKAASEAADAQGEAGAARAAARLTSSSAPAADAPPSAAPRSAG